MLLNSRTTYPPHYLQVDLVTSARQRLNGSMLVGVDLVEQGREDEHHHSHLQGEQGELPRLAQGDLWHWAVCIPAVHTRRSWPKM